MLIHRTPHFTIYFGDASDMMYPQEYLNTPADIFFAQTPAIDLVKKNMSINQLFFAHQVHGVDGIQVTPPLLSTTPAFTLQADFLHTSTPAVGIGVMTADCLPIIFVDPVGKVVAVIHAGWRGAVQNIAQVVLHRMYMMHGTKAADMLVFLGPSARVCCYQVGPEFVAITNQSPHGKGTLEKHNDQLFFDVPKFVSNQLIAAGVQAPSISQEYNICTICDTRFFSHRRDAQHSGRQMSIISLM